MHNCTCAHIDPESIPLINKMSNSKDIIIRNCKIDDIKEITNIYNYYITLDKDVTTFEEIPVTSDDMLNRYNNLKTCNFPYIVATDVNDNVMGYAYSGMYKPRSAYRFSAEDSIYIHHEHTGKGIGSLLLKELLVLLKHIGIKQVVAVLGTQQDNPGSYALHKKFGFVEVGVYKNIGYKHGVWVDRLHMQCMLDDNSAF